MFNNFTAVQYLKKNGYREYKSENHYINLMIKLHNSEAKAVVVVNNNGNVLVGKLNVERIGTMVADKFSISGNQVLFIVLDQSDKKKYCYKGNNVIILNTFGIFHGHISNNMKDEYRIAKEMYQECKDWEIQTSSVPSEQTKPFVVYIIVLVNIVVYFIGTRTAAQTGIYPGVQNNVEEYYRYVTYMFMHSGFAHLLTNIITLLIFGTIVEKKYGSMPTLICYLFSGIYGGIVSTYYGGYIGSTAITVGASGAIYGLIGIYVVCMIYSGNSKVKAMLLILLSGVISLNPMVDSACHIGGMLGGILFGMLFNAVSEMLYARRYKTSTKRLLKKGKRLNSISNF